MNLIRHILIWREQFVNQKNWLIWYLALLCAKQAMQWFNIRCTDLPLALFWSDGRLPGPYLRADEHKVVAGLHSGLSESVLLCLARVSVTRLAIRVKNDHSLKQNQVVNFPNFFSLQNQHPQIDTMTTIIFRRQSTIICVLFPTIFIGQKLRIRTTGTTLWDLLLTNESTNKWNNKTLTELRPWQISDKTSCSRVIISVISAPKLANERLAVRYSQSELCFYDQGHGEAPCGMCRTLISVLNCDVMCE